MAKRYSGDLQINVVYDDDEQGLGDSAEMDPNGTWKIRRVPRR